MRFCPQCGSASVEFSPLAGGAASCRACKWQGVLEDLLGVPVPTGDSAQLVGRLFQDLRTLLSGELGVPYLKFLLRWGFLAADLENLTGTLDRKKYARYIMAIAKAIFLAIIEVRQELEREKHGRN